MKKRTSKQKRLLALRIVIIVLASILAVLGILAIANAVSVKKVEDFASSFEKIEYESKLEPVLDENGYSTFITDDDFKVVQLSDVHIGAGFLSVNKDKKAVDAVAAMLREEKPDLVVVTGDTVFPVPFISGSFNNKTGAKIFADLMENLGVYWAPVFGNHDTEVYSFYNRGEMSDFYSQETYKHCLYQAGPDDIYGKGNYVINVKNSNDELTQSLFMIDSNDYLGNPLISNITWSYDAIHEDQVKWYEETLNSLKAENGGKMPNSLAFFHIPLQEYKEAWDKYRENGFKDSEEVKYFYGEGGEKNSAVFPGDVNFGFFETAKKLGSTKGMFCGHDHLNNFSLEYQGIRLSYGYTVDYLAYPGVSNFGRQRGCTVINVHPDGSFNSKLENFYQEKYKTVNEKEKVSLDSNYHSEHDGETTAPVKY